MQATAQEEEATSGRAIASNAMCNRSVPDLQFEESWAVMCASFCEWKMGKVLWSGAGDVVVTRSEIRASVGSDLA